MCISIVIPNYNGYNFIIDCCNSLFRGIFKKFELIIVDNGSDDESCRLIKENYPEVRIVKLDKNYGFAKAVNEGIKIAKGEYVILLNNDTEVDGKWLLELINCIEKDEKIFSCSSKMINYNHRAKVDDAGDNYTILGWTRKRGMDKSVNKYNIDCFVFSSCAGAAIYRKKVFDEIGYFDENFFAYMEDVDVSYRAKINGYKNVYCSKAIVYHIGSATSGSKYNSFKVRLATRNNIYVVYKNMPFIQFIINLPFLLLGFLIKGVFFSIKGFSKDYFMGFADGFKGLKNIRKTKFKFKNLKNYIAIEFEMIINTLKYVFEKIFA